MAPFVSLTFGEEATTKRREGAERGKREDKLADGPILLEFARLCCRLKVQPGAEGAGGRDMKGEGARDSRTWWRKGRR